LYREFHCDIYIYAYNVPWLGSPPPSFSLIAPLVLLGTISKEFIALFSYMCTKYINYIHPPSSLPLTLPLSLEGMKEGEYS
jgi:hypothetical protein